MNEPPKCEVALRYYMPRLSDGDLCELLDAITDKERWPAEKLQTWLLQAIQSERSRRAESTDNEPLEACPPTTDILAWRPVDVTLGLCTLNHHTRRGTWSVEAGNFLDELQTHFVAVAHAHSNWHEELHKTAEELGCGFKQLRNGLFELAAQAAATTGQRIEVHDLVETTENE